MTSVRFWSVGEVTRVAVEVSGDFRFRSDHLENPARVYFDLVGAKPELIKKGMHVIPVGDRLLKQIRIAETIPGTTRVVLDLDAPAEYLASQLSNPDRLMIELHPSDRTAARESRPPIAPSVTRMERLTDTGLRPVEADMAPPVPARIFIAPVLNARLESLPSQSKAEPLLLPDPPPFYQRVSLIDPPKLGEMRSVPPPPPKQFSAEMLNARVNSLPSRRKRIIEDDGLPDPPAVSARVRLTDPPATAEPIGAVTAPRVIEVADAKLAPDRGSAPKPSNLGLAPLPAKRNSDGDRSLTRVLGLKLGRVALDPGHGGHDAGTNGPTGLLEKDLVLDVSLRLGALIEQRMGSEVIYTRTDDTFVPLEERTRFANEKKADLFLSIHANSSPYRYVSGVETYYLNFTTSRTALDLAARENASSQMSIFDLKEIVQKIALKDKIEESREFATRIQASLYRLSEHSTTNSKDRGIRKAPFVVLIGANMPSVLAEIGFLTNAHDENLMKRSEYRQKIAEAIYRGLSNYASTLSHFQVAQRSAP